VTEKQASALTPAPQRAKLKSHTGITTDLTEDTMPSLTDLFVAEIERRILTGEWRRKVF
jgi:hypothetical protein